MAQKRFIDALAALGSVGQAVRAVDMTRNSAYRLRARPDAESFSAAWDRALDIRCGRIFDIAMTRALDGHTMIGSEASGLMPKGRCFRSTALNNRQQTAYGQIAMFSNEPAVSEADSLQCCLGSKLNQPIENLWAH